MSKCCLFFFTIGVKHGFSYINIRQVPWELLKTQAEGRGFQHLPRPWRMLYIRQVPWELLKTQAEGRGFNTSQGPGECYIFARSHGNCWKPRPKAAVSTPPKDLANVIYSPGPMGIVENPGRRPRFSTPPKDLANVNALKNHVWSLLVHKNWKHLLHFALFLAQFCYAFSPMSRERNFTDYAHYRAGQYTSRNGSKSVARYDHIENCAAVH